MLDEAIRLILTLVFVESVDTQIRNIDKIIFPLFGVSDPEIFLYFWFFEHVDIAHDRIIGYVIVLAVALEAEVGIAVCLT